MMAKRKSTGKRQRFEIFKRDRFRCVYCGRSPPEVLLHMDHVEPVANGGDSDPSNLVTACSDCNLGKSAVPLSVVAPGLQAQADEARERAEQVRAYSAMLADLRTEREEMARTIWSAYSQSLEWPTEELRRTRMITPREDSLRSIRGFLEKLTPVEILGAIEIAGRAADRNPELRATFFPKPDGYHEIDHSRRFRYFCGVCWRTIRERGQGAA